MEEYIAIFRESMTGYSGAYSAIMFAAILFVAAIANWITKYVLLRAVQRLIHSLPIGQEDDKAVRLTFVSRLAHVVPALVLMWGVTLPELHLNDVLVVVVSNVCSAFVVLTISMALCSLLDLIDLVHRRRPDAASKPIKGYLQLGKILIFVVALILIVSTLINRNPLILLSGLGAMAAVLMLIFQDTILSLVASLQIGTNDMVRIGDWIEMPSQNADGDVIEVALHTVKVQNWDKTITTIPVRKLITDSFKNWRGMFDSGGRRIKRSLFIDQRSIRFLDDDEISRLEQFVLLDEYLEKKRVELKEWNHNLETQGATSINNRRVTNLGTFRAYIQQYLRSHQGVNQNMLQLVRQLQPGPSGIPLEVYCFTSDTRWVVYEGIQADIFDHLLAILPTFDLRVFQQCSDTSGMVMTTPALLARETEQGNRA